MIHVLLEFFFLVVLTAAVGCIFYTVGRYFDAICAALLGRFVR